MSISSIFVAIILMTKQSYGWDITIVFMGSILFESHPLNTRVIIVHKIKIKEDNPLFNPKSKCEKVS